MTSKPSRRRDLVCVLIGVVMTLVSLGIRDAAEGYARLERRVTNIEDFLLSLTNPQHTGRAASDTLELQ